ncbi:MAG: hypothetical protein FWG31_00575 [Oscillospiraceae bacterium]|nr:hypothetical protein [Oscillospiraceae bacterium]
MKKFTAILLIAVMSAGLFAGCGGRMEPTPIASPSPSPSAFSLWERETPAPAEPSDVTSFPDDDDHFGGDDANWDDDWNDDIPLPSPSPSIKPPPSFANDEANPSIWTEAELYDAIGVWLSNDTGVSSDQNYISSDEIVCLVVRANGSKMGIDGQDILDASELSEAQLSPQSDALIKAIRNEGNGRVMFTSDHIVADIVIRYCVTYPFYGNYGTTGSHKAYSCWIDIEAFDIKTGSFISYAFLRKDPGNTVNVRPGSAKSWQYLPTLLNSSEIAVFVDFLVN